jgi:DNA-binding MarR family transcriptional regulator
MTLKSPNKKRSRPNVAGRRASFDSLEQETFLSLWRTYDRLRALEDELFAQFELTPQQYNVLRLLQAKHPDGMPTLQLAARMVSRAPDITRILDWLEGRKWIERRRRSDNRRVVDVQLSSDGLALLQEIAEPLRDCHQRQLGHLSATDLKRMCQLLRAAREPHESNDSHWK